MSLIIKYKLKKILNSLNDRPVNYIIIDVREPEEYYSKHIRNSINIPYHKLEERKDALPVDKNMLIIVYCRSGRRSKIACSILSNLGYNNVFDSGSIFNWHEREMDD